MKEYYVYGHYTKDTQELFYIGVGTGRRAYTKGRNNYWGKIVAKHGYEVKMMVTGFDNRDDAVDWEVGLQRYYKPRACFRYGDRRQAIVSEETKRKMSVSMTGFRHSDETKKRISQAGIGRITSDETRTKLSESTKGRKKSEETKKRMAEGCKGNSNGRGNKGRVFSDESKKRMAEAKLGKKQSLVTCPHCNKIGGNAMKTHHFDNCKLKGKS